MPKMQEHGDFQNLKNNQCNITKIQIAVSCGNLTYGNGIEDADSG